jgi:hypothetical protein
MRLRSFNALGNPNFEIDQRRCGNATGYATGTVGAFPLDRWSVGKVGTMTLAAQQVPVSNLVVPGTNFLISQNYLSIKLTAQEASLGAGDYIHIVQTVEGPRLRELINDTHSVSLLVSCTSALTFSLKLSSGSPYYTLSKLCQITTPNQWTLIPLPNLPIWTPSATWSLVPGASSGYTLGIGLAAGSTWTSPANDTWQSGNFIAGPGISNFASLPVNTIFQLGFVQHEPGAVCTTLIDCPWEENYQSCLRYYQKSYNYEVLQGTATGVGSLIMVTPASANPFHAVRFHKPLAANPTMAGWSIFNGQANAVYDTQAAVNRGLNSFQAAGTTGFSGVSLASQNAAVTNYELHYSADTGL